MTSPVDAAMLPRLREVAVADAAADDVTPPLTPGPEWTPERIAWFEDYHRACAAGLDGPRREATWAVLVDGEPVGAVRLGRTDEPGVAETGIWLARRARGRGIAPTALGAVVELACDAGLSAIRADTSVTNLPALAALRRLGFTLAPAVEGRVGAHLVLRGTSRGRRTAERRCSSARPAPAPTGSWRSRVTNGDRPTLVAAVALPGVGRPDGERDRSSAPVGAHSPSAASTFARSGSRRPTASWSQNTRG